MGDMLIAKLVAADGSGAKYALKWQGVHEASLKPVLRDTEVKTKDGEGDEDVIAEVRSRSLTKGLSFARFPDGGLRCGRRGDTRILGVFVEERDMPDGGVFKLSGVSGASEPRTVEIREVQKDFVMPESIDGWRVVLDKLSPESAEALADAMLSRSAGTEVSPAEKAMATALGPATKPANKPTKPAEKAAPKSGKTAPVKGKGR